MRCKHAEFRCGNCNDMSTSNKAEMTAHLHECCEKSVTGVSPSSKLVKSTTMSNVEIITSDIERLAREEGTKSDSTALTIGQQDSLLVRDVTRATASPAAAPATPYMLVVDTSLQPRSTNVKRQRSPPATESGTPRNGDNLKKSST